MKVYIPTFEQSSGSLGHGEGSVSYQVWRRMGVYGNESYPPVFSTEDCALDWIKSRPAYEQWDLVEIELTEPK